jgi:two-component system, OmpR family, response regulator
VRAETTVSTVVLRWPAERERAELLALEGVPRLFLVGADGEPPRCVDPLSDWVRLPVDGQDLDVRLEVLVERARRTGRGPTRPEVDGHGRLLWNGQWIPLSPIEELLAGALVQRCNEVVSDKDLIAAAWGAETPAQPALRIQVMRLRRRIEPLGLEIRTVRGRGYVLQAGPLPPAAI